MIKVFESTIKTIVFSPLLSNGVLSWPLGLVSNKLPFAIYLMGNK